jgi:DNA-binding transcriptional MerR regulator
MPYKEKEIEKLYYSISEVADMFDVNASLIRFWEKEFSILKPKKNKKGNRLFTKDDIENLRTIYHLVKERGFTLQGAKDKLKENKSEVVSNAEVIKRLQEIRKTLVDLKNQITDAGPVSKKPATLAQKLMEIQSEQKPRDNDTVEISPNQITLF